MNKIYLTIFLLSFILVNGVHADTNDNQSKHRQYSEDIFVEIIDNLQQEIKGLVQSIITMEQQKVIELSQAQAELVEAEYRRNLILEIEQLKAYIKQLES